VKYSDIKNNYVKNKYFYECGNSETKKKVKSGLKLQVEKIVRSKAESKYPIQTHKNFVLSTILVDNLVKCPFNPYPHCPLSLLIPHRLCPI
jgi:hypothetical protein